MRSVLDGYSNATVPPGLAGNSGMEAGPQDVGPRPGLQAGRSHLLTV